MKQLLTSLLLGLSVLASAQGDGIQYPFPYNPDGNSDGYISLPDMLDLLAVYGQEYPQSFYSDTTVAVLNLGRMGGHNCMQQAENAGSDWRIPRISELAKFSPVAVNAIPQGQSVYAWFLQEDYVLVNSWSFNPVTYNPNYDHIPRADSSEFYQVYHRLADLEKEDTNSCSSANPDSSLKKELLVAQLTLCNLLRQGTRQHPTPPTGTPQGRDMYVFPF